ncbi:MAG: VOC family protein [Verrucomicrobiota bacterium]|jgi:catechol 2,3-dioxygenase-like lactoylglutathione lyase family enzyme
MDHTLLKFHHFGLAVPTPDSASRWLSKLGYEIGDPVFDAGQNVYLALCRHETQPPVEIIWPGAESGPVDELLRQHESGVVYHLCYETQDLVEVLSQFKKDGLRLACISRPKPTPLFGGRKVSFYNVVGMGLVEILESDRGNEPRAAESSP